jgi:predicted metal-binding membrane protein
MIGAMSSETDQVAPPAPISTAQISTALAVGLVSILAWAVLLFLAVWAEMSIAVSPWAFSTLAPTFITWTIMMAAMMLPASLPMVIMARRIMGETHRPREGSIKATLFVLGYAAAWTGFSLAATVLQSGLQQMALLTPMLTATSTFFTGLLFCGAGLFQFSRLKTTCLELCRSPLGFFLGHWRDGRWGAFYMGLAHGAFCLGCCWALMLLLFTFGVMNLYWVVALTATVMLEKLTPFGRLWSRFMGAIFIVGGISAMVYSVQ